MAECEEETEDKRYWTDLNKTLDRYIKKHKVPELVSAKLFWLDKEWTTCYTKGIVSNDDEPLWNVYETKWNEESKESNKL